MNILKYIVYGGVVLLIIGLIMPNEEESEKNVVTDIDLNIALDVTVDTLHAYQKTLDEQSAKPDAEQAFLGLADALAIKYNEAEPPIYSKGKGKIGVLPQKDASLLAYDDADGNKLLGEKEDTLFKIEIDGDKGRVIASDGNGAVNDHSFSGTSLLAGFLLGSLLSRQRSAGVSSNALADKKTVTSSQAAKSRAGSGSHSRGK